VNVSEIIHGIVDRYVATDIPDILELDVDACLAVLVDPEQALGEHARARQRLQQLGRWFTGSTHQVAARIEMLSALDPVRRTRRRIALSTAWADLLAE
jgi:hypothetical protein